MDAWIYIDFFLRVFANALAWCLAIAIVGAFAWDLAWKRTEAAQRRRVRAAKAWLEERIPSLRK